MKRFSNKVLQLTMVFVILLSTVVGVQASDTGVIVDESKYVPKIKLSSTPTIIAKAGRTDEFSIRIRNVGTSRANNVFPQIVPNSETPFNIYFSDIGNTSHIMQSGTEKTLKLIVDAPKSVKPGTYEVQLSYTYTNQFNMEFSETDKLFVKIENDDAAPRIMLYDITLEPSSIMPGSSAKVTARYINNGGLTARNVKIGIEGLEREGISIQNGLTYQTFSSVTTDQTHTISFQLTAARGMRSGNYPITFFAEYTDDNAEEHRNEQPFFVNVGGDTSSGFGDLQVLSMTAPTATFGVGQPFTVSFNLKNTGDSEINNLKITAGTGEGDAVVPTSPSVQTFRRLNGGETKSISFRFAATSNAKSKNYPISFLIEYEDGGTDADGGASIVSFSQYAGVNVYNPDADDDDKNSEAEANKNIPKIIISSYHYVTDNPDEITGVVNAGEQFDLFMTLKNTHPTKIVKNVKVSMTSVDKDDKVGATIFSPVNASNTLYVDQIVPGGTVDRQIRYYTINDAQPQNYSIDVIFEYEDGEGNPQNSSEIVGINVAQPVKLEVTQIEIPPVVMLGEPIFLSFSMYNVGKVSLNNLKVSVEGNFDLEQGASKTTWYGELLSQMDEYYEGVIYANEEGELNGAILIEYDSPSGEHIAQEIPFTAMAEGGMMMGMDEFDMMEMEGMEEAKGGLSLKYIVLIAVGILALGGGIGFVIWKKRKKKVAFDFDEDDDLDADN